MAADAANADAVRAIFAAKGRPANHPVIVHLPSAAAMDAWAGHVPEVARLLAAAFWPGPLTLILPKAVQVDPVITGGQDTVGNSSGNISVDAGGEIQFHAGKQDAHAMIGHGGVISAS